MSEAVFCPFRQSLCTKVCGLAVQVDGKFSTCAIAVMAVRGTDHTINSIPIDKEAKK